MITAKLAYFIKNYLKNLLYYSTIIIVVQVELISSYSFIIAKFIID